MTERRLSRLEGIVALYRGRDITEMESESHSVVSDMGGINTWFLPFYQFSQG